MGKSRIPKKRGTDSEAEKMLGLRHAATPTISRMNTGLLCETFPGEKDALVLVLLRAFHFANLTLETLCRARRQT